MTTRTRRLVRRLTPGLAVLVVLVAACSNPDAGTPEARAEQQTRQACRERANQIFAQQNRGAVYQQNNDLSPFSSSYTPGVTTRGLGEQYGRDEMIDDCVRNKGTDTDAASGATLPPAAH